MSIQYMLLQCMFNILRLFLSNQNSLNMTAKSAAAILGLKTSANMSEITVPDYNFLPVSRHYCAFSSAKFIFRTDLKNRNYFPQQCWQ